MIDILLATYNGQKYLKQQIDSIFAQSNQGWQLLIRDDGSDDNTLGIIEDYMAKHPNKVRLITGDTHLGPASNFGRLLECSSAEYIMFSDQDDVWLPNKIDLTLNVLKAAEQVYPDKPVLVHTDLRVVDSGLNTIADSMWNHQKLFPSLHDLSKIAIHSAVTGCAMMINKKAKAVSMPIPVDVIMHDWWIAINVAMYGKIVYVSIPSILYRQHFTNYMGTSSVQRINILNFFKRVNCLKKLLSAQYKMIKKVDPNTSFRSLLLNTIKVKIAQRCR